MRKIVHVDMDAFYASVEQCDRPELRGLPVVVAWSEAARGVVLAASYEARRFGVRSAIPATRARRLCPSAVFVRPRFERYHEISRQVRRVCERHTLLVEPVSLDEAYLDLTVDSTGLATATASAEAIRREIREETGLTASAGVAPNKFLAKIASDWKKPDGLFVIKPHQVEAFLNPLPVERLPGVGRATAQILTGQGVKTVGDLLRFDLRELAWLLGKYGARLWELARGIDERPVVAHQPAKSISAETTFAEDLLIEELEAALPPLAERVWDAVERKGRIGRTVTVKLKTSDFRILTRRATPARTWANLAELCELARELLGRFGLGPEARFRLLGVGLSNFADFEGESTQRTLF